MDAAGNWKQYFRRVEPLELVLRTRRLRFVPRRVYLAFRVDVMVHRIVVENFQLLPLHNPEHVRFVDAPFLIQRCRFCRGRPTRARQTVLDPDKYVPQSPVGIDDHRLRFLWLRVLPFALRIRRHIDLGHRLRIPVEKNSAGDCSRRGLVDAGRGEAGFGFGSGLLAAAAGGEEKQRRGQQTFQSSFSHGSLGRFGGFCIDNQR